MIGIDSNFLIACELEEHIHHASARGLLNGLATAGERFALSPQVLTEFLHIVTDGRRLQSPRSMDEALELAGLWRTATDVTMLYPTSESVDLFLRWMDEFHLGRKRVLDTMLAATYATAGVLRLATINSDDFRVFGVFQIDTPITT